jgi:hypothetical protein
MTINPLHDGLRIEPTPGATTLVIFGASGDLTRRKLLPAIYRLSRGQRLPARFSVIGVGRSELGDERFREQFFESLREFAAEGSWRRSRRVARPAPRYISGGLMIQRFTNASRNAQAMGRKAFSITSRFHWRFIRLSSNGAAGLATSANGGGAASSESCLGPTCRARASSITPSIAI